MAAQLRCEPEHILLRRWNRPLTPAHAIIKDDQYKKLVLVIRGTFGLRDVLLDLACEPEEALGGICHQGMLRYGGLIGNCNEFLKININLSFILNKLHSTRTISDSLMIGVILSTIIPHILFSQCC